MPFCCLIGFFFNLCIISQVTFFLGGGDNNCHLKPSSSNDHGGEGSSWKEMEFEYLIPLRAFQTK